MVFSPTTRGRVLQFIFPSFLLFISLPEQALVVARDSANRWADNIETLRSWMKKKFAGRELEINSFFKEVRKKTYSFVAIYRAI